MPTYTFVNKDTSEEITEIMSIAEMEDFLILNKNFQQVLFPVGIADPTRLGVRKPDSGFRDVLKNIKSKHRKSTVNTW
jgi:hypothetical protein